MRDKSWNVSVWALVPVSFLGSALDLDSNLNSDSDSD